MKTITTAVAILAIATTATFAGGFGNNSNNNNNSPTSNSASNANASANQAQGQAQGQIQGQGQAQSQNTTQANSQTITNEGSASAPGVGGCEIGITGGVVGTSAGLCFPSVTGNSVRVSNALIAAGRPDLAIAILMNTPVAKRAHRVVKKAKKVALSGFTKCALVGKTVRIRYRSGADKPAAKAACLASLGY